jgi:outer membrane receptor for ferrienterochelin and colicin
MKIGRYLFTNCIIIICLLSSVSVFAGTKGKIAGKVTDASTGEPLMGVNVIIEGTTQGAASDVEGEYYILNVSPGVYNLKVTMIGFKTKIVEKVRVQVDLTSKIDISLQSLTLQLGQEVTVVAKKEIQKDLTSSERSIQSDQIEILPARDVSSLLSMQAGIVKDAGGNLHIRGGRTSEISYLVDGVQMINPMDRSMGIGIDDQAIEELKAITGTFNAEYGQALSGVVNIVTKKGSDKFTINATAYTGDFNSFDKDLYSVMSNRDWATAAARSLVTKSGRLFYDFSKNGITSYQQIQNDLTSGSKPWLTKEAYLNGYSPFKNYDLQLNVSGPLSKEIKNVSYFVAGRYQYKPGYSKGRRYFMPWGLWTPVGDTVNKYEMPDGELVNLNWYRGLSTQAKLFWNLPGFDISYGFYYNKDKSYSGGQKYLPDGGRNYYTDRYTHILSMTYVASNSTFIDFKGSYYNSDSKSYLYEDPYDYRYMPTNTGDFQQYMFRPTRDDDIEVKSNTYDYSFWGNDVGRSKGFEKYFSARIDLTSQVDKNNLVKLGASGRWHNLENDNYNLQFSQSTYRPIIPDKSSPYHTYYTAKPYEFAAYIQDKIEFNELIINVGLRFDYFYSDGKVLADEKDPQIYSPFKMEHIYSNYTADTPDSLLLYRTLADRETFWYKKPDPKYQFSPRFGFSFPITAQGVIHFSYGHFFQNPEFRYLYQNPNFWITGAGAENLVGNANLNAERTIMYELGLQQQLMDNLYLHVTGFYRDIRDWVSTGVPIDTYRGSTYYSYVNKDNAVAKGITLSSGYNIGEFSFNLDYTYMEAKGTSSDSRDAYNDISAGKSPRVALVNLAWDQPHAVNFVANYTKESWNVTLVGTLNSGFPYTPEFTRSEAVGGTSFSGLKENSERKPTTINFDLRVSKTFALGDFRFQANLDITNLFDTRNALYVYNDTGLPDFTLQDFANQNRLIEISNSKEYFASPGMYSSPRYISLGLRISYN